MISDHIDMPMGRISISVSGKQIARLPTENLPKPSPQLPQGMRVDDCQLRTITVQNSAHSDVLITLDWRGNELASIGGESGQYFDGFGVETPTQIGNFGIRGADWWAEVRNVSATSLDPEEHLLCIKLTPNHSGPLEIELAAAWITHPQTDDEIVSPWFASDLAMK